jgi:hypothetical protein
MRTLTINLNSWPGIGVLGLLYLMINIAGCSSVTVTAVGDEYSVISKDMEGNLARKTANSFDERVAVLSKTLRDRKNKLGGAAIKSDQLNFVAFGESEFILPNGQSHILTILYQTYKGARIVDSFQYGSFDKKTGELRTVRALFKDPAKLVSPPEASMEQWSQIHQNFREYLNKHKTLKVDFIVEQEPVISAKLNVAGYMVRYAHRNADNSLSRFAAIMEPKTDKVHVLYDINMD